MSSPSSKNNSPPSIIERSRHPISRKRISESALKVLYRLKNHGHQSFLVGGAVRDLVLGIQPKDFDIATDATPEEVRALFNNCRLIGRRFRLAHVRFGREIIEVATFRGEQPAEQDGDHKTDATGRIIRDNVYGEIGDDVWRRDFTVNALYYNIQDYSIWDYVGGLGDIEKRKIRLIGDPEERYREDPVRMLRAIRFAAKLGFKIDQPSETPLAPLGSLLANVPPARLADESIKLFLSGAAQRTFELLREHQLFSLMFTQTERFLRNSSHGENVQLALNLFNAATKNTDSRIAQGKPVTPAFLNAVFLWPVVEQRTKFHHDKGKGPIQSVILACDDVISEQQQAMSIPRRLVLPIREMLVMQYRLRYKRGLRALRLSEHPRFRAAYDLLLLRAAAGSESQELADFWTEFQELNDSEKREAVGVKSKRASKSRPPRRRRSGRKRKKP